MGLFGRGRRSEQRLPRDIVPMMEEFGRFEFDPQASGLDSGWVWNELQVPLGPQARSDPAEFVTALADTVVPAGGWAVYGAAHTCRNLLPGDFAHPSLDRLEAASLRFLRELGVPSARLTGHERDSWVAQGGSMLDW